MAQVIIRIYTHLYENYTQSSIINRFSFTLYVFTPYRVELSKTPI
jgi:hypothetical protein